MGKNSLPCNDYFCHVLRTCILFPAHYHQAHEIRLFLPAGFLCQGYKWLSKLSSLTNKEIRCHRHFVLQRNALTHTVHCDNLPQKTVKKTSILSSQINMTNTHRHEMSISNGTDYQFDLIFMEEIWTLDTAVGSQMFRDT